MLTIKNSSKLLNILFSILMAIGVIGFIIIKKYHYIYNSVVIYCCFIIYILIEKKKNLKLSINVKILILMTISSHIILGEYFNLYLATNWFDNVLHIFGSFSFSLFFYSLLCSATNQLIKYKILSIIIVISIGITLGALLENIEFALDAVLKTNNQHGQLDINLDLLYNTIGATAAGILTMFKSKL